MPVRLLPKAASECRYVPERLAISPYIENTFDWLIDHLGPLLLRR
jgi:hypothetical protein